MPVLKALQLFLVDNVYVYNSLSNMLSSVFRYNYSPVYADLEVIPSGPALYTGETPSASTSQTPSATSPTSSDTTNEAETGGAKKRGVVDGH